MRFNFRTITVLTLALLWCLSSCQKDKEVPDAKKAEEKTLTVETDGNTPKTPTTPTTPTNPTTPTTPTTPGAVCCSTKNVIILIIDGARYSETWGDYTRANVNEQYKLYPYGVLLGNFKNNGSTNTEPGHAAILTGVYEDLENFGAQTPQYPSIFQQFLKSTGLPAEKAWLVASKDKLEVLANAKQPEWAGKYQPRTNCGANGIYTGYRADEVTMEKTKYIMDTFHPNLMMVNLKDPDASGHSNLWDGYIRALKNSDAYVKELYDRIQSDPVYRDKTTLIVTNDHGRHLDHVANGFIDHGDGCDGCRHIQFFAIGPDFKQGLGFDSPFEQIDIAPTVAKLLNFKMDYSQGKVISDIFK